MNKPKHAWMVRAGNENELASQVEVKKVVAIGWSMGDLSGLKSREQFKARYLEHYPDHSPSRVGVNAGQVYRFVCEIKEGDYVLTSIKDSREVIIGLITGPYRYDPNLFKDNALFDDYPNIRPVNWLKRVSRDDFPAPARNSMGSTLTVFNLDDHLDEIHKLATGDTVEVKAVVAATEEETPPFHKETESKANELIADLISKLDPYDFQDLVAAVLRAMGFRAVSTPPGRDKGIDIVAHPDALGFGTPRIKGQVKHRKDSTGGAELRSFLGSLRQGDNGLFVSTGGFTSDAKQVADGSREPVTLLDRDGFIKLLLEHYEQLEPEYKSIVPLRKVWIPAE
ncbi:MAG: restriction endonuclease [Anaerolineae bacterium]|nr:restriction endonuclease [Anaerolineae bacterium]